jgi:hypothetical protein
MSRRPRLFVAIWRSPAVAVRRTGLLTSAPFPFDDFGGSSTIGTTRGGAEERVGLASGADRAAALRGKTRPAIRMRVLARWNAFHLCGE